MPHSTMTQDYGIQMKRIQMPRALNFCVALQINTWNIFSSSLKNKKKPCSVNCYKQISNQGLLCMLEGMHAFSF